MSTTIQYTREQRETLYDASWKGSGKGAGAVRAVKMVRPECSICQIGGDEVVGWWNHYENTEDSHDHYWGLRPKTLRVPKYIKDEDGDLVLDEAGTKAASRTKFIRVPNIVEVLVQESSNSGLAVQKFTQRKGFKTLQAIGVAPMCELYGCGKSFPSVRTEYGDYCNVTHAKLAIANEIGVKFTVWNDGSKEAKDIMRKELQEIQV